MVMGKFGKSVNRLIGKAVNRITSVTAQATGENSERFEISHEMSKLCRKAGAEGIVLLKNEKNALPVKRNETISVFGRVQNDFFYEATAPAVMSTRLINPDLCRRFATTA